MTPTVVCPRCQLEQDPLQAAARHWDRTGCQPRLSCFLCGLGLGLLSFDWADSAEHRVGTLVTQRVN